MRPVANLEGRAWSRMGVHHLHQPRCVKEKIRIIASSRWPGRVWATGDAFQPSQSAATNRMSHRVNSSFLVQPTDQSVSKVFRPTGPPPLILAPGCRSPLPEPRTVPSHIHTMTSIKTSTVEGPHEDYRKALLTRAGSTLQLTMLFTLCAIYNERVRCNAFFIVLYPPSVLSPPSSSPCSPSFTELR